MNLSVQHKLNFRQATIIKCSPDQLCLNSNFNVKNNIQPLKNSKIKNKGKKQKGKLPELNEI